MFEKDLVPIKRKRTSHLVENRIREAILRQRTVVGTKLPSEREFAEILQVSRNSVRQALLSLEREGLIHIKNGTRGGAFVSRDLSNRAIELMINMCMFDEISLEEILQVRLLIEPFAAAEAAKNATSEEVARLREANLLLWEEYKERRVHEYNPSIHQIIAEGTGNKLIVILMQVLIRVHTHKIKIVSGDDTLREQILHQHETIIEAIANRDSKLASEIMRKHILTVHEFHKNAEEKSKIALDGLQKTG
jgi:GntR family transcriptional repressor for pyruvate dehydrogenase complex